MTQDQAKIAPQEDGAASAPPSSEDMNAAIDRFMGESADPTGEPGAAAAEPDKRTDSADLEPAPSDEGAADPQAAGDTQPASENPNDDIWNSADPKLREAHLNALRDANLRYEGTKGRLAGTAKALQELQSHLAELEARGGQQPGSQDQPGQGQPAEADKSKILEDLREEYPDVAGPILDELATMRNLLATIQKPVETLQAREMADAAEREAAIVMERHPDWPQLQSDERILGWMETKPSLIRDAIARNTGTIVNGAEVALIVDLFKADMGIGRQPPAAAQPDPVQQRRERQIQSGRDASGGGGASVATGIPKDIHGAIDHFLSQSATG